MQAPRSARGVCQWCWGPGGPCGDEGSRKVPRGQGVAASSTGDHGTQDLLIKCLKKSDLFLLSVTRRQVKMLVRCIYRD